ncbi:MAG: VWA domain-containing protein [Pelatocladus maniniholoensis HA4357-MV3]|jgi:hypothetical protein|uniref:VWA domain-containing protein n=1 Tax=Pelatocladus maniniholoensis HA4357-MV3 TaxID=1117104 RepID=A0A9E3LU37_9NOST|nr:VWA domain-containing protein [Pelatocladus maniniholoensis HA4357-MV3]BAZ67672.1 hypothetical protein NIES4106_24270 [Fischerella sp. NIES-4106]
MKPLNYVDLCFVVDTTGSMGSFIQSAQQQLLNAIKVLSTNSNIDLQIGLVEYRDHPPQDNSFVTRVYSLTPKLQLMQKVINQLRADGGGDGPEALYSGVYDACTKMNWRRHSCRFILLVGDAPPHGFGKWLQEKMFDGRKYHNGDAWPDACPSGLDVQSITATAENHQVIIHGLCMSGDMLAQQAFRTIAQITGGQCVAVTNAKDVIDKIVGVLQNEFSNLEFDQKILETVQQIGHLDSSKTAEILDMPRLPVAGAIARLGKRGFFDHLIKARSR